MATTADEAPAILLAARIAPVRERLAGRPVVEATDFAGLDESTRARIRVVVADPLAGLSAADMDRFPNLGLIVSISAGHEGIDKTAAAARGVQLVTGAGVNSDDVADLAVALFLAAARGVVTNDRNIREGGWRGRGLRPVRSVGALSVGIVGLGGIGRAVAARLAAFGCRLAWTGPRDKPDTDLPFVPELVDLARRSDALIVCAPLEPATARMVDRRVIEALGPRGLLVNVGRGALVDEDELIAALREGRLGGAALDVFAQEPTPPARWADVPNVVLSPHVGGMTYEALEAVFDHAARQAASFLDQP